MNWSDVVVVIVAGGIGQAIIAPPGNPDPTTSSSHDAVLVNTGWVSRRVD
jgi:hypothetical protein